MLEVPTALSVTCIVTGKVFEEFLTNIFIIFVLLISMLFQ